MEAMAEYAKLRYAPPEQSFHVGSCSPVIGANGVSINLANDSGRMTGNSARNPPGR
jgi:hypothetical protein